MAKRTTLLAFVAAAVFFLAAACNHDDKFGGDLAHIVVMQHVTMEKIDAVVAVIKAIQ